MQNWSVNSWKTYPNAQAIEYADEPLFASILDSLAKSPALVEVAKIRLLSIALADVQDRAAFVLQAGECAERFSDAYPTRVQAQANLLNELSELLAQQLQKPIVTVGRIAGQYAKPRTAATETRGALSLPNYRGDLINAFEFDALSRTPDPQRLRLAYEAARQSLNVLKKSAVPIYTSHEVLHLPYEQRLTRDKGEQVYNLGTHFPWVGVRTARLNSAHIEYVSGLANPIALKIDARVKAAELKALLIKLNPQRVPGRLSLIHRLGANHIAQQLPILIEAAQETDIPVLWMCDPMHANTQRNAIGHKTRLLSALRDELQQACQIHQKLGSYLGGVHLELTSDAINECSEQADDITEPTYIVDPRLNREQATELLRFL